MSKLARRDLESILGFLGDAAASESDDPYEEGSLLLLQALVPATWVIFQHTDYTAKTWPIAIGVGPEEDGGSDDEVYWTVGGCPTQTYRLHTGDLSAVRLSDVVDLGAYHRSPIYQEYFGPAGVEHIIDFGLPAPAGHTRSLLFFRERGTPDFSERDHLVLEAIRPHLYRSEMHARLRQQLANITDAADVAGRSDGYADLHLTPREREIVELVAAGKTNAEIAATLWVSPSTVKKHLENVYAKTGIGRRAAIAALQHRAHPQPV